jgi:flagellar hook protein FlgE
MPLSTFSTALTGLNNNAFTMNVVGNNLANLNTTAFKGSKTTFAELLGGLSGMSDAGNPISVGLGSVLTGANPVFTQGAVAYTGRPTDAAINGNGFFVVDTGNGLGFTRSGNFGISSTGQLLNSEGFKILGYPAVDGVVNTSGTLAPISIGSVNLTPKATTDLSISANLDSQAADKSTFASSIQMFDSLGAKHTVTLTFTRNGTKGWDWEATIPAVDTGGKTTDPPVSLGKGSFTFDGTGQLTSPVYDPTATPPTGNATLSLKGLANGAKDMDMTFSIFDTSGKPRFTSYASASTVSSTAQDGYATSVLTSLAIDGSGVVYGIFDNGKNLPLAQLVTANFPNVQGLLKFQGSTFVAFGNSGDPSVGAPGTGGRGSISGGSLEQSNVDIATEFTNLIVAERGYQANSRMITTTDQLMQDTLNLVR